MRSREGQGLGGGLGAKAVARVKMRVKRNTGCTMTTTIS